MCTKPILRSSLATGVRAEDSLLASEEAAAVSAAEAGASDAGAELSEPRPEFSLVSLVFFPPNGIYICA